MQSNNKSYPKQGSHTQNPEKTTGSKKNTPIIIIIIVVLVLGVSAVGFFVGYPYLQQFFEPKSSTILVSPPLDSSSITIPVVEEVIFQQESSPSVPKGFYIIVGSFLNKSYADDFVDNKRNDYELKILYFEELSLYRVSAGYYDNIHKAYNDLFSIRDLDCCSNAWVLENL